MRHRNLGTAPVALTLFGGLALGAIFPPSIPTSAQQSPRTASTNDVVQLRNIGRYKGVLVTGNGKVLYTDSRDRPNHSTCQGSCATTWPPYELASGRPHFHVPKSLAGKVGTIRRGTRLQLTYERKPLYTYSQDPSAHSVNGNDVQGFYVALKADKPTPQ